MTQSIGDKSEGTEGIAMGEIPSSFDIYRRLHLGCPQLGETSSFLYVHKPKGEIENGRRK
jgi:hypothetical protein